MEGDSAQQDDSGRHGPIDQDQLRSRGEALRTIRRERNLTQSELAARCGVSERSIRELERGKVTPRPATLRALAEGLALRPAEINAVLRPFVAPSVVELAEVLPVPLLDLQEQLATLNQNAVFSDSWTNNLYHVHQVVGEDGQFQLNRMHRGITSTVDGLTHRILITEYDPPLVHRPRVDADFGCRISQGWVLAEHNLVIHEIELGRPLARGESAVYGLTVHDDTDPERRASLPRPTEVTEGSRATIDQLVVAVQFLGTPPRMIRPLRRDGARGESVLGDPVEPDSTGTVSLEVRNTPPGRGYGFSWVW